MLQLFLSTLSFYYYLFTFLSFTLASWFGFAFSNNSNKNCQLSLWFISQDFFEEFLSFQIPRLFLCQPWSWGIIPLPSLPLCASKHIPVAEMPACSVAQGMMVVFPWKMNRQSPFKWKSTKYYISGLKWKYTGKTLSGVKSRRKSPLNCY